MAWSAAIALLLPGVGVLVYRSITGLVVNTGWVAQSHIVIETLTETFSLLKDVQDGQRGYVITGEERYLDPYKAALPDLHTDLVKLKILIADNHTQLQRLAIISTKIDKRVAFSRMIIKARREQGFDTAQLLTIKGNGQQQMDAIRVGIEAMQMEEMRLLEERNTKMQNSARFALGASSGGLAIVALIVFLMLQLVRRESLRRMEVEDGLERANLDLQTSLNTTKRLTQEMTAIASLAELLHSCQTMSEAFNVIARSMPHVFSDATAEIGLINASQNLVEVTHLCPAGQVIPSADLFSPDDCWALRGGRIHLAQDARADVLCPHLQPVDRATSERQSLMCLPLMAHGEALGVLTLRAAREGGFSSIDQRAALAVAEPISLALANLKLQETLRVQSIRDPLTNLFNRRYLEASFERELSRAGRHQRPLCVVMIDIDFFKRFNDEHGHQAGDFVLKEFGAFLQNNSRGEDIVCRYGGEEFTVILPDTAPEVARQRAEELREGTMQLQVEYRRQRLPAISISAGVAAFPLYGDSDELLRAADEALYRAKKEGRNRVVVANAPRATAVS